MSKAASKIQASLREHALSLPGAVEELPWGERVVKVNKKIFVFFGKPDDATGTKLSLKLPESGSGALSMDCAEPTGYGLGKSGWVTLDLDRGKRPPIAFLREWIEESYRAIAPKKLVAELEGR